MFKILNDKKRFWLAVLSRKPGGGTRVLAMLLLNPKHKPKDGEIVYREWFGSLLKSYRRKA